MKKTDSHIFTGMQRDRSISKQPAEFLWEAHNLRITAQGDNNTLMSITNERGTLPISLYIGKAGKDNPRCDTLPGHYVGHCVLNDYLVLFTHEDGGKDYIFRIKKDGEDYEVNCLTGQKNNKFFYLSLGLDCAYPLKTFGYYENEYIQKVYWIDGKNQPRVINIVRDKLLEKQGLSTDSLAYTETSFDFVQPVALEDSLSIRKLTTGGSFPAGVIQYAITYYNKYGQESAITCVSPLIYTSFKDRAGSAEQNTNCAFKVTIHNPDTSFDYARIYSILRTSLDATPTCKRIFDLKLNSKTKNSIEEVDMQDVERNEVNGLRFMPYLSTDPYTDKQSSYFCKDYNFYKVDSAWVKLDPQNTIDPDIYLSNYVESVQFEVQTSSADIETFSTRKFYKFTYQAFPRLLLKLCIGTDDTTNEPVYKYVTWSDMTTGNEDHADVLYVSQELGQNDGTHGYMLSGKYYIFGVRESDGDSSFTYNHTTDSTLNGKTFSIVSFTSSSEFSMSYTITDDGNLGEDIDPSELLYKSSSTIIPQTMEQKDGTLFFGNIKQEQPVISSTLKAELVSGTLGLPGSSKSLAWSSVRTASVDELFSDKGYHWGNSLCAVNNDGAAIPTAGFKCGETYRLGVQFQYKTGIWSEPIFLSNRKEQEVPVYEAVDENKAKITIPTFTANLPKSACKKLNSLGFKRVRGVIAQPSMEDRTILAQGVGTPAVASIGLAAKHSPDFQSSWFFRPYHAYDSTGKDQWANNSTGRWGFIPSKGALFNLNNRGAEIQGVPWGWPKGGNVNYSTFDKNNLPDTVKVFPVPESSVDWDTSYPKEIQASQCDNLFYALDTDITFHSPEQQWDSTYDNQSLTSYKLRRVGIAPFRADYGAIRISTSSVGILNGASVLDYTGSITTTEIQAANYKLPRLCAGWFYKDSSLDDKSDTEVKADGDGLRYWMVYPWHRSGSLNNDCVRKESDQKRTAVLSHKTLSNLLYSGETLYAEDNRESGKYHAIAREHSYTAINQFSSDQVSLIKNGARTYYGNMDTLLDVPCPYGMSLTPKGETDRDSNPYDAYIYAGYRCDTPANGDQRSVGGIYKLSSTKAGSYCAPYGEQDNASVGDHLSDLRYTSEQIRMKYKSSPHTVISLDDSGKPFWDGFSTTSSLSSSYTSSLPILELYKDFTEEASQRNSEQVLQSKLWIPAGDPVVLRTDKDTTVSWDYGDTWYQRYDCLKTYPFADEDPNSIVEIGSFMVESHVNMDGRYDRNRGLKDNTVMSPSNFNLLNSVYSQLDNFFNYRIQEQDYYDLQYFPTMVTWSTQKNSASSVDNWTHITLASTLDLDGTKGELIDLITHKDQLYGIQTQGFSSIQFNSRVQIPTSDNVPIEISNSYKVDGYRLLSGERGCLDKFQILSTDSGIYFIDALTKHLYLFDGQTFSDVSDTHGLSTWFNIQDNTCKWQPAIQGKSQAQGIRLYYDIQNKDLYIGSTSTVLGFSESLGQFISYFDYQEGILNNYNRKLMAFNSQTDETGNSVIRLWECQSGKDNSFFGNYHPTSFTFISNADNTLDKIFTNLEIRADFYTRDESNKPLLQSDKFFDTIQVEDEYQDTGEKALIYQRFSDNGFISSNTKKKFRVWRCDIPRAASKKTSRIKDRIRNTWCKATLTMNKEISDNNPPLHMELHDIQVIYYI